MKIAVVGGSGGIGQAFVRNLAAQDKVRAIHATFNNNEPDFEHPKVSWRAMDVMQQSSVQAWSETFLEIDWLINAAGMLHTPDSRPEKSIRDIDPGFFLHSMSINALPTLLLAKATRQKFSHGGAAVFATISAKVGSIEDNRLGGWYSYRASKAALNMCIKTLAIEWKRTHPNVAVAALHPGTTNTGLSKPFQRNVPQEKLFSPDQSAAYMLDVLDSLTPEQSGRFWAYDGTQLPW